MGDVVTPGDAASSCLVVSYLTLRKAVGAISVALPFVLAVGNRILGGPGIQSSISAYYYTGMRDVFVGSLCVTGVLLPQGGVIRAVAGGRPAETRCSER